LALFSIFLLSAAALAGTPGSFRGVIVDGPESEQRVGWIFVKGKNGLLRRVEIAKAKVAYADSYPTEKRLGSPRFALKPGIEVRVTATQGKDGEWHAVDVEIMVPDSNPNVSSAPTVYTEVQTS
jgi:hypothetical protein